jgi:hypothetical protein
MKTPEELAEEYTKDWWGNLPEAEGMRKSARENFLAGYKAAVPQWISVKDRLPEPHKGVIWCLKDNLMAIGSFDPNQQGIFIDSCFFKLKEATHWMPLPQPPKEEV